MLTESKPGKTKIFLDTTYLLPYFGLDLAVEGFTPTRFIEYLTPIDEIHFSEISIIEAKAKINRLNQRNRAYHASHVDFGASLGILREDDKIHFHSYEPEDDIRFNFLAETGAQLDAFDMVIVAQASRVGRLLTEDGEILSIRNTGILKNLIMQDPRIESWKEAHKPT